MPMASQLTRAGALVGRQAASRKPREDASEQVVQRALSSHPRLGRFLTDTLIDTELFTSTLACSSRLLISRIILGASLVAQWLRVCLPMQGTRVRALVWEDTTCRGATGPVSHNY